MSLKPGNYTVKISGSREILEIREGDTGEIGTTNYYKMFSPDGNIYYISRNCIEEESGDASGDAGGHGHYNDNTPDPEVRDPEVGRAATIPEPLKKKKRNEKEEDEIQVNKREE